MSDAVTSSGIVQNLPESESSGVGRRWPVQCFCIQAFIFRLRFWITLDDSNSGRLRLRPNPTDSEQLWTISDDSGLLWTTPTPGDWRFRMTSDCGRFRTCDFRRLQTPPYDSGWLWTIPDVFRRLKMTPVDSGWLRLQTTPDVSRGLQTIPNDSRECCVDEAGSEIFGVRLESNPNYCQLHPSLIHSTY